MNGERRTTNGERWRALLSFVLLGSSFAVLFAQEPAFKSGASELVVLPGVGHFPHQEAAEQVTGLLLAHERG